MYGHEMGVSFKKGQALGKSRSVTKTAAKETPAKRK